jgi:hypothetical protein
MIKRAVPETVPNGFFRRLPANPVSSRQRDDQAGVHRN